MAKIKITDLPNKMKIHNKEMKRIKGGYTSSLIYSAPGLAYLDYWDRNVTAIEDPLLADVALGGPSTQERKRKKR